MEYESFRAGKVAEELAVLAMSCQQPLEVFIFWLISKCTWSQLVQRRGELVSVWQGERNSTEKTEGTVTVRFLGAEVNE